jgi:hypothetical protein
MLRAALSPSELTTTTARVASPPGPHPAATSPDSLWAAAAAAAAAGGSSSQAGRRVRRLWLHGAALWRCACGCRQPVAWGRARRMVPRLHARAQHDDVAACSDDSACACREGGAGVARWVRHRRGTAQRTVPVPWARPARTAHTHTHTNTHTHTAHCTLHTLARTHSTRAHTAHITARAHVARRSPAGTSPSTTTLRRGCAATCPGASGALRYTAEPAGGGDDEGAAPGGPPPPPTPAAAAPPAAGCCCDGSAALSALACDGRSRGGVSPLARTQGAPVRQSSTSHLDAR